MKIGILGENKSVLAFGALGVQAFGVSNKEELSFQIKAIKETDLAILLIEEDIAQKFGPEIEGLFQETLPACLVIPGINRGSGKAREGLKKTLERALGSESFIN